MKKPVVDYRQFRLNKLNQPEFSHLKLLAGWIVYFTLYFLTENLIPAEKCTPVYWFLDDLVPFCEWFVIPYFFWYVLIVISLLHFMLYNVDNFKKLSTYIIITQAVAMIVYITFPTRQDLRPEVFPRENILTDVIGLLYAFDTNTGVCPSLHVGYSLGIASVWVKDRKAPLGWKIFVVVAVIFICLSTAFIKQHSTLDIVAAIPLGILAEILVFHVFYKPKKA